MTAKFSAKQTIIAFLLLVTGILFYAIDITKNIGLPETLVSIVRVVALITALVIIFEKLFEIKIYTKIFLGLILGVVAGIFLGDGIAEIKFIGDAFIRLIRMIIIPLVFASLLIGAASMNPQKMGRVGLKTISYYLLYTIFALSVGLLLANIFTPGNSLPENIRTQLLENFSAAGAEVSGLAQQANPIDILLKIIPVNIFESLAGGQLLPIIFFAIFTGITLTMIPSEKSEVILKFFDGLNDAMIKVVHIVIKTAPYGVFAIIASVISSFGTDILLSLFQYTIITLLGLILLNFTYPFVVKFFAKIDMGTFLKGIREAQLIAFSTSSSSATLPVTIETAEEKLGVPTDIASFVLPLGATINMNGTALYHGVSALFIAQVFGIDLSIFDQLLIVLTSTLAAIGTAGAPMAGSLMLVIVLEQVGIPTEGIALILGVERILDMFRTTINITGDVSAAVVIAATENELSEPNLAAE